MLASLVSRLPRGRHVTALALGLGLLVVAWSAVFGPVAAYFYRYPLARYALLAWLAYELYSLVDGIPGNTLSEVYWATARRYTMLPHATGVLMGLWLAAGDPELLPERLAIACLCYVGGHLNWPPSGDDWPVEDR